VRIILRGEDQALGEWTTSNGHLLHVLLGLSTRINNTLVKPVIADEDTAPVDALPYPNAHLLARVARAFTRNDINVVIPYDQPSAIALDVNTDDVVPEQGVNVFDGVSLDKVVHGTGIRSKRRDGDAPYVTHLLLAWILGASHCVEVVATLMWHEAQVLDVHDPVVKDLESFRVLYPDNNDALPDYESKEKLRQKPTFCELNFATKRLLFATKRRLP